MGDWENPFPCELRMGDTIVTGSRFLGRDKMREASFSEITIIKEGQERITVAEFGKSRIIKVKGDETAFKDKIVYDSCDSEDEDQR